MDIFGVKLSSDRLHFPLTVRAADAALLEPGQIISVRVEGFSEGRAVLNLDNHVFKAYSEIELTPGQNVRLLVQGREGDQMILRLLDPGGEPSGAVRYVPLDQIASLLPEAGMPATQETVLAARALVVNGLSITAENIRALVRFLGADIEMAAFQKLDALAAAMARGIEPTAALAASIDNALPQDAGLAAKAQLLEQQLSNLAQSLDRTALGELRAVLDRLRLDADQPIRGDRLHALVDRLFTPVERPLAEAFVRITQLLQNQAPDPGPGFEPPPLEQPAPAPGAPEPALGREPVLMQESIRSLLAQVRALAGGELQTNRPELAAQLARTLDQAVTGRTHEVQALTRAFTLLAGDEAARAVEQVFARALPARAHAPAAAQTLSPPEAAQAPQPTAPGAPPQAPATATDPAGPGPNAPGFRSISELLILELLGRELAALSRTAEAPATGAPRTAAPSPAPSASAPAITASDTTAEAAALIIKGALTAGQPEPGSTLALRLAQDLQGLQTWLQQTLTAGEPPLTADRIVAALDALVPHRELTWLAQAAPELGRTMEARWLLVRQLLEVLQGLQTQPPATAEAAPTRDQPPAQLPAETAANMRELLARLETLPESIRAPLREFLRLEHLALRQLSRFTEPPAAQQPETARGQAAPAPITIPEAEALAGHIKAMNLLNSLESNRPDAPQFLVFEVPIKRRGRTHSVMLKVFRREQDPGADRDQSGRALTVAILIQTDHLQEVQATLELDAGTLKGEFLLRTDEIRNLFAAHIPELVARIEAHDYTVRSFTATRDEPAAEPGPEPNGKAQSGYGKGVGKIDIKI